MTARTYILSALLVVLVGCTTEVDRRKVDERTRKIIRSEYAEIRDEELARSAREKAKKDAENQNIREIIAWTLGAIGIAGGATALRRK